MIHCDIHRPVTPIICDRCGEEFEWTPYMVEDSYDFHWVDPTDLDAEFQAESEGWIVGSDETVCPDCLENEEEESD